MGRKLAEATKACRARRTRGETGLRCVRWLVLVELRVLAALCVEVLPDDWANVFAATLRWALLGGAADFLTGLPVASDGVDAELAS
jgi:hypothetical protein